MRIVALTPRGEFHSKFTEDTEENYKRFDNFLSKLNELEYMSFETDGGAIYMTKEMIQRSIFVIKEDD